jgi:hypothetical protein
MRILVSILITFCLLFGTHLYTQFADRVRASAVTWQPTYSVGKYSIEIDRTFDCVPDDLFEEPGLTVRFRGQEIYRSEGRLAASQVIRIEDVQNVEVNNNDINITAFFDPNLEGLAAMQIRIYRDNAKIQESTIADTAELGSISGSVSFFVDESPHTHEGGH